MPPSTPGPGRPDETPSVAVADQVRAFVVGEATWPQVQSRPRRLLLVPLGSLEQHGPHLPLDTDTRLAAAIAAAAAARLPTAALAPPMPLGSSGEHSAFPGTLSVGTPALTQLLVELLRDASRDWGAVLFVNGHGGNLDAVRQAVGSARSEGRVAQAWWPELDGSDLHAGHTETSLMLHVCPGAVRMDLAEPGCLADAVDLLPTLRAGGVGAVSPNGVLGDPTGASAGEGRHLFEVLVDSLVVAARTLIGDPEACDR
ncbi:MAG: mycofactocin biosynthesis peptidyl-dipeptidase MftE [Dermatophilaceae bacterium]